MIVQLAVALLLWFSFACGVATAQATVERPDRTTRTEQPPPQAMPPPGALATPAPLPEPSAQRWYTPHQVEQGAPLFAEHCAACHGAQAQGAFGWRDRNPEGKLPPPPLNGTGHAWHHPLQALGSQIKFGTPFGMGSMTGFADRLTDQQIIAIIAWFQSQWRDEIYRAWADNDERARRARR